MSYVAPGEDRPSPAVSAIGSPGLLTATKANQVTGEFAPGPSAPAR